MFRSLCQGKHLTDVIEIIYFKIKTMVFERHFQ